MVPVLRNVLLLTALCSATVFAQNELVAMAPPSSHYVHMLAESTTPPAGEAASVRKFLLSKVTPAIDFNRLVPIPEKTPAAASSAAAAPASIDSTTPIPTPKVQKQGGGHKMLRWLAKTVKRPVQALRGSKTAAA